jgi:hypothetical protein
MSAVIILTNRPLWRMKKKGSIGLIVVNDEYPAADSAEGDRQEVLKDGYGSGDHIFLCRGPDGELPAAGAPLQQAGKRNRLKPTLGFQEEKIQGPGLKTLAARRIKFAPMRLAR